VLGTPTPNLADCLSTSPSLACSLCACNEHNGPAIAFRNSTFAATEGPPRPPKLLQWHMQLLATPFPCLMFDTPTPNPVEKKKCM
jgi:hypothetical protein